MSPAGPASRPRAGSMPARGAPTVMAGMRGSKAGEHLGKPN